MALALYRKYRPRTFAEVIGQEHVTEPLSQALRSGRLHHAYLFSGPRGCGKTSSARILARSLNCEQGPTPEPCGVCSSCRSLANDGVGSIDVIEIDAASHGGVDDARDLREKAFFAPASSRYKIYVIDEAHMVSPAGFNALLKLVEEPPDYVKFIFATTEPEKVLSTIKSRTHHYPFRLIPPAVLRPYLQQLADAEGIRVEPAVFPLVVRAGGGSVRDTLSVLDQLIAGAGPEGVAYARAVALLGVTDVALIDEMCDALAAGDGASAYATIDRVAEAGHDPRRFASDLLERFRDLIILQQVPDAVAKGLIDGPTDQLNAMSAQATRLGPATLSRCADIVHNGLVEMRGTTAPRLLLELITARMLLPGADDSAGALLQRLERVERRLTLSGAEPSGQAERPSKAAEPSPETASSNTPNAEAAASTVGPVGDGSAGGGRPAARAAAASAGRRAPADQDGPSSALAASGPAPRSGRPARAADSRAANEESPDRNQAVSGGSGRRGSDGNQGAIGRSGPGRPDGQDRQPPVPGDGWADEGLVEPDEASDGGETRAGLHGAGPGAGDAGDRRRPGEPGSEARQPEPAGVLPDAPEEPAAAAAPGQLSAAAIRDVWPEIITAVGRQSKKVAALASGAIVRDLDGSTVVLTFRFPAHAKMVAAEPDLIGNALYEALGGRWQIRCEVAGEAGEAKPAPGGSARSPAVGGTPAQPGRPAAAPVARQREAVTAGSTRAAAASGDDDDWPEPARPGGLGPSAPGAVPAVGPGVPTTDPASGTRASTTASASGTRASTTGPASGTRASTTASASGSRAPTIGPASGTPTPTTGPVPDLRHQTTGADAKAGRETAEEAGSAERTVAEFPAANSPANTALATASRPPVPAHPSPGASNIGGLAAARAAAADAHNGGAGARTAGPGAGARTAGPRTAGANPRGGTPGAGDGGTPGPSAPAPHAVTSASIGTDAWSEGSAAEEPPYDPDYDGPPPAGPATYEGFDPGDEPLDDVIDEKGARQSSEEQAMRLLQEAFGAEKIGES